MKHQRQNNKKIQPVQILRAVIQLITFILIPELFITVFSAIGSIFTAVIGGTFVFSEQMTNIFMLLAVFIITFIWGRFFCGFLCSFGAMQDLLWFFGKRIPVRPVISQKADRVLKFLKYGVLIFIVLGIWSFGVFGDTVWSPWTVFGMYTSPFKGFPNELMFLSVGGALLLVIMLGSLFIERFFCKYLCPLGALFTLASRFRIFKVKRDSAKCNSRCRVCTRKCAMSIPLYQHDAVNSGECINCMKCTAACAMGNIKVETAPAVTGTAAALALAGVSFAGTLQPAKTATVQPEVSVDFSNAAPGSYKDGTYTGSAAGYRGVTSVTVTVSNGNITSITIDSSGDDRKFLDNAANEIISDIISTQSTDVSAVSGATYSSRGIIDAVEEAIGDQLAASASQSTEAATEASSGSRSKKNRVEKTTESDSQSGDQSGEKTTEGSEDNSFSNGNSGSNSNSDGKYADGTYTGSGSGFRGTTSVSVKVEGGVITDITVTSYQDDRQFFTRAESGVISEILSAQSINVSTVSGATFSSNSIIEAVADALGEDFTNPNSSMSGGHHMH